MLDMVKQVAVGYSRGQVGGVGEGRELIAKVGTGDNCPGADGQGEIQCRGYSHKADAQGSGNRPGAANTESHQGADQAGGDIKIVGGDQFHPVIDHAGNCTRQYPAADQGAYHQQDKDGVE